MPSQHASIGPWEIAVQGFITPVGLEIAAVRLWGEGASLETEPLQYALQGEARMQALIHEASLAEFLRRKLPDNMSNAEVALESGRIVVKATVKVLLPVAATAVCTLRVVDGSKIFVNLESVEMLGAGVKSLVQKQIDAINPVLDSSDWPLKVSLDEVRIEPGRIVAEGTVLPPPAQP